METAQHLYLCTTDHLLNGYPQRNRPFFVCLERSKRAQGFVCPTNTSKEKSRLISYPQCSYITLN